MQTVRALFIAAALGALSSCADDGPPPAEFIGEPGPVVSFDRTSYSWDRDRNATWLVANPLGVNAFYYPGDAVFLEHWAQDHWEPIYPYGGLEAEPVRLGASDSLSDSLRLTANLFPRSGWYRLHTQLYRDSALTQHWPVGNSVSAAVWVGP